MALASSAAAPASTPGANASAALSLSTDTLSNFGIAALFQSSGNSNRDERVNSLSFSDCGRVLVSAHNDGVVKLYNGETGARETDVHSRQYGCKLVTHTHHELCVLHAALITKPDDVNVGQIAYHSLHDNKIIRFFKGHTGPVTSLAMNPRTDWFLSTSRDGTFRLWDLRTPNCQATGQLDACAGTGALCAGDPTACFDLSGKVFAVATPTRGLALYDATDFSKGPFETTPAPLMQETVAKRGYSNAVSWTSIEFSPDDRFIAAATADRGVLLVDSFYVQRELTLLDAHPIDPASPCNVSFSPCGGFLTVGGADGHVYSYAMGMDEKLWCSGADTTAAAAAAAEKQGARIALGKLSDRVSLPPLPLQSGRWSPPWVIMGESLKSHDAALLARRSATDYSAAIASIYARTPLSSRSLPSFIRPPAPLARTMEEGVSRHEGPVRAVKWHPRSAVFASGSKTVAVWVPTTSSSAAAVTAASSSSNR